MINSKADINLRVHTPVLLVLEKNALYLLLGETTLVIGGGGGDKVGLAASLVGGREYR